MKRLPQNLTLFILTLSMGLPSAAVGQWLCSDGRRCFTCEIPNPKEAHDSADVCHSPATDLQAETDCRACCDYVISAEDRSQRNLVNDLQTFAALPNPGAVISEESAAFPHPADTLHTAAIRIAGHSARAPPSFA